MKLPNEGKRYRTARNKLLEAEIDWYPKLDYATSTREKS